VVLADIREPRTKIRIPQEDRKQGTYQKLDCRPEMIPEAALGY